MAVLPTARRRVRMVIVGLLGLSFLAAPAPGQMAAAAGPAAPALGTVLSGAAAASPNLVEVQQRRRAYRRGYRQGFRQGRVVRRARPYRYRGYRQGFRQGRVVRRARPYRYRGYRGRPYYGGGYRNNAGAAVAAGIIGLAAGAIAGSALANSNTGRRVIIEDRAYGYPEPYSGEWYTLCARKYRSFRASDGTYLGYDGRRHVCRIP